MASIIDILYNVSIETRKMVLMLEINCVEVEDVMIEMLKLMQTLIDADRRKTTPRIADRINLSPSG